MPSAGGAQRIAGLTHCAGQRIAAVHVRSEPPIFGTRLARFPVVARTQRALHAVTSPAVIRNFLLLRPGDRCSEPRRVESERILRAQPYLADARILVIANADSTVDLEVQTVDEVSSIVALRLSSAGGPFVRKLRLGSQNVAGQGFYLTGEWQSGLAYRDGYAGRLITSQVFGQPLQATFVGARRQVGGEWLGELSRPFLTDFQRFAWDALLGMDARYLGYHVSNGEPLALRTDRRFGNVGFIARLGAPGALALLGTSVSYEREETASMPVLVRDSGLVPTSNPVLDGRFGKQRTARANFLAGVRNITFLRVTGFEALEGPQDVWKGFQLGTLVGKGVKGLFGTDRDDLFLAFDAYGGIGSPRSFLASRIKMETRRDQGMQRLDRSLLSATTTWYRPMWISHTLVSTARFSSGWRSAVPFQLVLDDREAGIIGFRGSRSGGGRRIVARIEDRVYFGRVTGSAALGATAFVEGGKLWASDAPFGVTTPTLASVGIGLLAAVPPRSQRLWRMEIASRLTADPRAGRFEFRLTNRDRTRELLRESPDITRSRVRSVPTNLFVWPAGWGQRQ